MKFGAMNFPIAPVLSEIDTFARLDFDYLELAMDPPMAHYRILLRSKTAIVGALEANGLGLVCHLPTFLSTADLTDSIRQASIAEILRSMEVAAELGAGKVVLHPSMATGMGIFVLDSVQASFFDFLAQVVSAAQQLNLVICLENMFPRCRIGVEPDDFEAIFKRFPSLKLTLDTGHANIEDKRGRRLKGLTDRFDQRIGHLHISDNKGKIDDHLAVGQGTVKFVDLVRRLKIAGYDDTVTLEVFDKNRLMLVESRERIKAMFKK